jgi:UDP-2,3-diacylglucosamine hydrolase
VAAGNTLLAEPQGLIEAADRAGLFVTGVPA